MDHSGFTSGVVLCHYQSLFDVCRTQQERISMKLSDFKYPLPRNLIAKHPANPRDHSRLMVLNRADESITELRFHEIARYFKKGDCLVVNETRVFPARLFGRKEKTNAKIEVFLLRELNIEESIWDVIVDPARKVRIGNKIFFDNGRLWCEVIDNTTFSGSNSPIQLQGGFFQTDRPNRTNTTAVLHQT